MKRLRRGARVLAALALVGAAAGCATVPLTERSQLALVSNDQLVQLGATSYAEVLQTSTLSNDADAVAIVKRVGTRLAQATEDYLTGLNYPAQPFAWEFNLIYDDDTVNAWCLPGGKVAVYTGLLPVAASEAGLAVVMGHEIAHVVANHGNERMSEALLVEFGGQALAAAMQQRPAQTQNMFMTAYGLASQTGVLLPHSRQQESEADRIGLTLMAVAGYDPREAVGLWQRMAAADEGGSRAPSFLSTHPVPGKRIENIQAYLPEAMAVYRGPTLDTDAAPPAPVSGFRVQGQSFRKE